MSDSERCALRDSVVETYMNGGRSEVASLLGVRYNSAGHFMQSLGISQKELRLAKIDKDVKIPKFKNPFEIESHTKYYLLGVVLGDGSVRKRHESSNSMNLCISSSDYDYLKRISVEFGSPKIDYAGRGNFCMSLTDYPICKSLLDLGIVPAKSKVGMSLPKVDKKYFFSFLLGLLDSDGCVLLKNKSSLYFQWYGHPSYMEELYGILSDLEFSPKMSVRDSKLAILSVFTYSKSCRLADLMYENVEFCLGRKLNKVLERYGSLKYRRDSGF